VVAMVAAFAVGIAIGHRRVLNRGVGCQAGGRGLRLFVTTSVLIVAGCFYDSACRWLSSGVRGHFDLRGFLTTLCGRASRCQSEETWPVHYAKTDTDC